LITLAVKELADAAANAPFDHGVAVRKTNAQASGQLGPAVNQSGVEHVLKALGDLQNMRPGWLRGERLLVYLLILPSLTDQVKRLDEVLPCGRVGEPDFSFVN